MTTPRLALTFDVDVDEVWNADDPSGTASASERSQGMFDVRRGVADVLEKLAAHSAPATFFVPGRVAERFPAVVEWILGAGHEVAAHGYTHRSPEGLDAAEQRQEVELAHRALEAVGATPIGYRSPSWAFDEQTTAALADLGYRYSSNAMDDYHPYRREDGLVELPVHWLLDDAAHFWFSGSTWNKKISTNSEVLEIWTDEIRGISARGGVSVLTFHPQIIGRPGRIGLIDAVLEVAQGAGCSVMTCADIAAGFASAEETS